MLYTDSLNKEIKYDKKKWAFLYLDFIYSHRESWLGINLLITLDGGGMEEGCRRGGAAGAGTWRCHACPWFNIHQRKAPPGSGSPDGPRQWQWPTQQAPGSCITEEYKGITNHNRFFGSYGTVCRDHSMEHTLKNAKHCSHLPVLFLVLLKQNNHKYEYIVSSPIRNINTKKVARWF